MFYNQVVPRITEDKLEVAVLKAFLTYYIYLEDPYCYYIEKQLKQSKIIQVYSSPRKLTKATFRSKTTVNEYDINQPGTSGVTSHAHSSKGKMDDADWVDKLFNVKKKKIVRPIKLDDRQPSTISKRKHGFSSSIVRMRSKISSRKSSRAWAEDSREQFLYTLTKERSEHHRRKNYLEKTAGKHDTEVMGLEIPIFVPNSSNEINNHHIGVETRHKINIQEPRKPKQLDIKTNIKVIERKKI